MSFRIRDYLKRERRSGLNSRSRACRMKRISTILTTFCACSFIAISRNVKVFCLQEHERMARHARQHFRKFDVHSDDPERQWLHYSESTPSLHERQNSTSSLLQDHAGNCVKNTSVVTFALNQHGVSGGFGDRLLGMVTTYYLAIMTNSSFDVQWTQPYNLSDFFALPSCKGHASLPGAGKIVRTAMEFKDEIVFHTTAADGQFKETASNKKLLSRLPGFQFTPMADMSTNFS